MGNALCRSALQFSQQLIAHRLTAQLGAAFRHQIAGAVAAGQHLIHAAFKIAGGGEAMVEGAGAGKVRVRLFKGKCPC